MIQPITLGGFKSESFSFRNSSSAAASHEATKTAEVLAVGEGIRTLTGELIAPSVAAGDKVLVENGAGINVKDGDDSVSIIREADILAVLA